MARRKWALTSVLRSALRKAWRWSPMRSEAMKRAKVAYGRYQCAECGAHKGPRDVAVDHLESVTPPEGLTSWDVYISRLFCPVEGLQVLCKEPCHKEKTRQERAARKKR